MKSIAWAILLAAVFCSNHHRRAMDPGWVIPRSQAFLLLACLIGFFIALVVS